MKVISLIFCLSLCSFAATYKGKNIDGKKYEAVVKSGGAINDARVMFDGRYVEIHIDKRIVTAKMSAEIIDNPHDIEATDGKNNWIIDVSDLE